MTCLPTETDRWELGRSSVRWRGQRGVIMELFSGKGYEVMSRIGQGTFAEVYELMEKATGKHYAGKVSNRMELLEQEGLLMKKIEHPLFPKWHDYWQDEEEACLIMEYIRGSSLADLLERRGRISQRSAVRIAIELADGLAWLHECSPSVFYRDLKPANIMIEESGRVRLIDLGAAGSQSQVRAGTAGYAAPEMFEAGEQSIASDIYSLGKVLHYMLTGKNPGRLPYEAEPVRAYDRRLWRGLEQIVKNCLVPYPEGRIPGMRELIRQMTVYHERSSFEIFCREAEFLLKTIGKPEYQYEKNVWKASVHVSRVSESDKAAGQN